MRGGSNGQRLQCVIVAKSEMKSTAREKTYYVLIIAHLSTSEGASDDKDVRVSRRREDARKVH